MLAKITNHGSASIGSAPSHRQNPRMATNLILLVVDDLGFKDLGVYGSSFYETPRLDALASRGLRFTDAYAASPVCSPTRASLLTGRYPARIGVTQWIGGHNVGRLCDVPYHHCLPKHELCLASVLREAGYQTWHVGKWHLGDTATGPTAHGFDVNVGGSGWGWPKDGYFAPFPGMALPGVRDGEYLTDHLTSQAIQLIKERDRSRPFFLNLWHYAVHIPIQAPPALIAKYQAKATRLGLDTKPALVKGEPFPHQLEHPARLERRIFQSDPTYAAMIENLDRNVGRLVDALEEQGVFDDTLLVFTSDNGGLATAQGAPTCNLPLSEGKGFMYEGGTRVCQIATWPRQIAPRGECSEPVVSTDIFPTFLDAAGLPPMPAQHVDGKSLTPLFDGARGLGREAIFFHYPHYSDQGGVPAASVRSGDYKLIRFFEDDRRELYNLREDIEEKRDLSRSDTARTRTLDEMLSTWCREIEALFPKPNPNYVPIRLPPNVDAAEV
jgi:arylsulfatase A-like enzyme